MLISNSKALKRFNVIAGEHVISSKHLVMVDGCLNFNSHAGYVCYKATNGSCLTLEDREDARGAVSSLGYEFPTYAAALSAKRNRVMLAKKFQFMARRIAIIYRTILPKTEDIKYYQRRDTRNVRKTVMLVTITKQKWNNSESESSRLFLIV